jgi:hypothetical protein
MEFNIRLSNLSENSILILVRLKTHEFKLIKAILVGLPVLGLN